MPKLLTPVQYEDTLGELNTVRPLVLADEVKVGLDIPVLNVSPANGRRFVHGKLLRCDNNGALIRGNSKKFDGYEIQSMYMDEATSAQTIEFTQQVYGVLWVVTSVLKCNYLRWTDPLYFKSYQELSLTGTSWLNFVGLSLSFISNFGLSGYIGGNICGFRER